MKANWIRYRLKRDRQIYECHPLDLKEDGRLIHTRKIKWGDEWVNEEVSLNPNEYEIIPEQDFYDFRNQTAREILIKLMDKASVNESDDFLIDKAISMTNKLIEKL